MYVSNLLTLLVFIQRLQVVRERSRFLRSKIREEEAEVWPQTETEATIPGTLQDSYVLLHRACSLYVLTIMCYIYRACSAPNNLKAQSCVDTTLVSTSGLAANTMIAGDSSRNHKDGEQRKGWTVGTSLKQ
jgi:hypothetical protein